MTRRGRLGGSKLAVEEVPKPENPLRPGLLVTLLSPAISRLGEGLCLAPQWLPRRQLTEEEAATAAHALHQPAAAGAGSDLPEEPLP